MAIALCRLSSYHDTMNVVTSGFLANAQARQRAIVILIGCLLLLSSMNSVNERALFLPTGAPVGAFSAVPALQPVAALTAPAFVGPPPFLRSSRLVAIANPPTALTPPAGAPGNGIAAPAFPGADTSAPPQPQPDAFTPAAPGNAGPSFGSGIAANPASPGGFFPGTATPETGTPGTDDPGTTTPGTETPGTQTPGTANPGTETPATETPGTGTPAPDTPTPGNPTPGDPTPDNPVPNTPTPVDPLPEPASWVMMITGFFLIGAALRRGRSVALVFG